MRLLISGSWVRAPRWASLYSHNQNSTLTVFLKSLHFVQEDISGLNIPKLRDRDMVARLAQSVEDETLNLRVVGSSPTLGELFTIKRPTLVV